MNSRSSTLARLSELLDAIESSGKVLRDYLQAEEAIQSDDYSTRISSTLALPLHADPAIANQASILRIASERVAQLVTPPRHLVFEKAGSFYTTIALHIAVKHDIATLISSGSKGLGQGEISVNELSKACKLDADLLARILRYLSQHAIFQEVAPNTFSNTAASSTLINNPAFKAHLDLVMYEGQLSAPFFEQLMAKSFAASEADKTSEHDRPPLSAFGLYSGGDPFYKWLRSPSNSVRGNNFDLAMRGMSHTEGLGFLAVDYPFSSFDPETLIVDVGGGIGSLAELLLPAVPHVRFVVQDLASVVATANDLASPIMKKWVSEGRVRFQVHDCFTPQQKDLENAVFVMKNLIHNYPDSKAVEILCALRPSNPSKLLIIDRLVTPHYRTEATSGAEESDIYSRLRAGIKVVGDGEGDKGGISTSSQRIPTMYDFVMASLHGSRTRTLEEWRALFLRGGFELVKVHPLRASTGQAVLEAIPV